MADKIIEARAALGLTQDELADKLGLDTITISRWERGIIEKPRPRHLYLLAVLADKPLAWFYATDGEETAA